MDTKKICKICDVLQIFVYLFINKNYCQQVYSSLCLFARLFVSLQGDEEFGTFVRTFDDVGLLY